MDTLSNGTIYFYMVSVSACNFHHTVTTGFPYSQHTKKLVCSIIIHLEILSIY